MVVEGKTARQVLPDYRGPGRILDLQRPPRLQHEQEPPQQAKASYAGIGIAHIDRDMNTNPLHSIEKELTEPRNDETRRQQTMSSSIKSSLMPSWQFWEKAITAWRVDTVHVKWIPGHQTQQDEDNGKISKHDRRYVS